MHPDVRQSEPGTCPLCGGMRLVPMDESILGAKTATLELSAQGLRQAGLRLATVEERDLKRELGLTGHFALNPHMEETVHNPIPGSSRVAVVHATIAGQQIAEGEVLIEFENELLAQQIGQLRDAIARYEELKKVAGRERQAQDMLRRKETIQGQLEDAGVSRQWAMLLAQEGRRREHTPRFPVRAPRDSVLLRTPIVEAGRYSRQGEALFRLADTSQLWLELETHARDLAWLQRGCRLRYESPAVPGRVFWTTLDAVETVLDTGHPEIRVRARATSAKGRILPGTWARTWVDIEVPGVLAIPSSAVLRSGRRDMALVAEGDGRFRPVQVTLGRRNLSAAEPYSEMDAGQTADLRETRFCEVLAGLESGQRVVSAGTFLLFSEADFQGALARMDGGSASSVGNVPAEWTAALDSLLGAYEVLRATLAEDREEDLNAALDALTHAIEDPVHSALRVADPGASKRLEEAVDDLALLLANETEPEPLEAARVRFGAISRAVVNLVRDLGSERVRAGQLLLFRCPMADDYGFDLWLQPSPEIANPFMGLDMPTCGVKAKL